MQLEPVGTRVLIKPSQRETQTAGGIFIPESTKERPQEGEVLAVGADVSHIYIERGTKVLFQKYSGTEYKAGDEEFLIVDERDILAIVRG